MHLVVDAAVDIDPSIEGGSHSFFWVLSISVGKIYVLDGVTIGCYPLLFSLPLPVLAQDCVEQVSISTRGNAIDSVCKVSR